MAAWISRTCRSYANYLADKKCTTCRGHGEVVVAKDTKLDVYDLSECHCVRQKLRPLSPDAGIQEYRAYVDTLRASVLKKAG